MGRLKLTPSILLGIPTTSAARRSVAWEEAMWSLAFGLGMSMGRRWVFDTPIAEARNTLCDQAIAENVDYLIMVSDDVLPPSDMVMRMLNKIGRYYPDEHGNMVRASMITGVYWTKSTPTEPYIYKDLMKGAYTDWKAGEFFPVDFAGMDAVIIEVRMLKELREKDPTKPFFSTNWVWEEGQQVSPIITEDFWFYTFARLHGYRLFCDTAIQCYHEDRATGYLFGLTADMPQSNTDVIPECGDGDELVADLGSGTETPYFGPNAKVVRFDARHDVRPDVRCDILNIPEEYHGKFDIVHGRHILEHVDRRDMVDVVKHWGGLLKDGGRIIIRVPNMEHAFRTILEGPDGPAKHYAWQQVYGGQSYDRLDHHANGYTPRKLEALLNLVGIFHDVKVTTENDGLNLRGDAVYRAPAPLPAFATMWEQIRAQEVANTKQITAVETVGENHETENPAADRDSGGNQEAAAGADTGSGGDGAGEGPPIPRTPRVRRR